ncbi:hypothetical protein ElyMa_004805500 [Elysia marginata]|uniref:Uncharacterized protein n=1 Tax=Elysia marginata TaxID=1093978 RepID=A0AAV4INF4_9GAST|nr:hypothetical protein ElyMa_004805500 [Elysia marginata]
MDYHTKYPEILMTPTITSQKITDRLEEIFARYGAPDELVSDKMTLSRMLVLAITWVDNYSVRLTRAVKKSFRNAFFTEIQEKNISEF